MSGEGYSRKQITMSRILREKKIDYNRDTMLCQAKVVLENKKPCQGFSVKANRRWTLDFDRSVDNSISDPLFILKLIAFCPQSNTVRFYVTMIDIHHSNT